MSVASFLTTASSIAPLLRSDELANHWSAPSALAEFPISGLAGHLARAVFNVETYLDAPAPASGSPIDAVTYFYTVGGPDPDAIDNHANRAIRERGEEVAIGGVEDLANRYDAARARLSERLPALSPDLLVPMFGGTVLPLAECLRTRVVELVVHADDLAVSLNLPTPSFDDDAARLAVTTLAEIALRRHGTVPLVRALARRERATEDIAAF